MRSRFLFLAAALLIIIGVGWAFLRGTGPLPDPEGCTAKAAGREGFLDQAAEVAEAFAGFAAAGAVALDALVTSAMPLTEAQQATITGDLRSRYGADLKVSFGVDQSLIGGLIIRVGDQVLANRLRTRLSAVQRNMLAS